jgi:putative peptidoglycan lipid II flippase
MPTPDDASQTRANEQVTIARRAGIVGAGTLASRVLGAVRDAAVASYFTISDTDAFYVAWTIPNTLRRVLGEGAVTAAIIPVFSEVETREGRDGARRYVAAISGVMLLVLSLVSLLGVLTAPLWTKLYAAGYQANGAKFELAVTLTRWVFPYIGLVGLAALAMGISNAIGRFAVAAFAPALLNIAVIAAPFLFAAPTRWLGLPAIGALALATLVGGVVQLLVQLPELSRAKLLPWPTLRVSDPAVRKTISLMGPVVLGSGIYQLNIVFSRLFASYLPTGSQSFLYYAMRLVEIPQSLFALAVASAALPSLTRFRNAGDHESAHAALRYSLRISLFVALPASIALVVLAEPTIAVLFRRGEFGNFHVHETAKALAFMAAATWAVAAIHPITRMYYAYNDTRTPMFCSALNLAVFVVVSLALQQSMGHVAIAAGTSAGSVAQLAALLLWLPRRVGSWGLSEVAGSALRAAAASAVMGAVIYDVARFGRWVDDAASLRNVAVYAFTVVFGVAVYAGACFVFRVRELEELTRALRRRRSRS